MRFEDPRGEAWVIVLRVLGGAALGAGIEYWRNPCATWQELLSAGIQGALNPLKLGKFDGLNASRKATRKRGNSGKKSSPPEDFEVKGNYHTKNATPSNRNKHEDGTARRLADQKKKAIRDANRKKGRKRKNKKGKRR